MVRRLISVELFLKISSQKTAGSIPASLISFCPSVIETKSLLDKLVLCPIYKAVRTEYSV